jgi:ATP-binding cassette subfamily F protein 3
MLNFKDLSLRRGSRLLFEGATFTINAGSKIGLTGANGTGKSSLFALIRGELHEDRGEFFLPPGTVMAHVAQETPALSRNALDYVLDGDTRLRAIETELADAEACHDGHRQARLHAEFDAVDGYTAPSRAAALLHGLGFAPGEEQDPVSRFSGGWRMRLNLAQALMCRSDLLLLDEPTNHLDLEATVWLEEWLRVYPGTLLLISHDREFLDRIVDHILHIEGAGIELYSGNYSDFERRRAERLAQRQAAYSRQQREIARIHQFVDRFRAKATKARQAQSRLKALARMELIAPAHADSPFEFSFRPPEKTPYPLLRLDGLDIGYGDKPVARGIDLSLVPGDRIGLLGPNGAGKSTFIKTLAGELPPLAGALLPAQDLRIGYFAQHQLEQLNPSLSPLQQLVKLDPRAGEQALRNYLGGFGFGGDKADGDVSVFSGGERARLVLAMLAYQRPNLLLLDEPTNHLDLEMRHALILALQDFDGAIILISHDRFLLRTVADRFLVIANRQVEPFNGDVDEYREWLRDRELAAAGEPAPVASTASSESASDRRERKRQEAVARQRLAPLRAQLKDAETRIESLSQRRRELQSQLSDNSLYAEGGKERLTVLLKEQGEIEAELTEYEHRWLSLSTDLERAEQD